MALRNALKCSAQQRPPEILENLTWRSCGRPLTAVCHWSTASDRDSPADSVDQAVVASHSGSTRKAKFCEQKSSLFPALGPSHTRPTYQRSRLSQAETHSTVPVLMPATLTAATRQGSDMSPLRGPRACHSLTNTPPPVTAMCRVSGGRTLQARPRVRDGVCHFGLLPLVG